jgi:hypothetical protein
MQAALFLAFHPSPTKKKAVPRCERDTRRAWKALSAPLPEWLVNRDLIAEERRLGLATLRLRCEGCRFRHLSPILPKMGED